MASSCSILVAIYTCCKQHISNMKWKMFDIASGSSIASTSSILSYKHSQSVTQTLLCLQYAKTSTPKQKEGVKLNFNDFQIFIYPDFSVAIHYFTHNPGRMSINSLQFITKALSLVSCQTNKKTTWKKCKENWWINGLEVKFFNNWKLTNKVLIPTSILEFTLSSTIETVKHPPYLFRKLSWCNVQLP